MYNLVAISKGFKKKAYISLKEKKSFFKSKNLALGKFAEHLKASLASKSTTASSALTLY